MKKIFYFISLSILVACGSSNEKKEDGFKFNRTKKEEQKAAIEKTATPVDLNNKGIGPMEDLVFDAAIDEAMVATGAAAFKQKCTACHKAESKLIGPAMKGIYERRHPAWVMNMLLNPTEMVKEDPIAKALLAEYNNILMINQNLSQEEARAIAEYLRTL
ncbi:MAG: c-type cytochrome [Flavobacteriaceae bacterium]